VVAVPLCDMSLFWVYFWKRHSCILGWVLVFHMRVGLWFRRLYHFREFATWAFMKVHRRRGWSSGVWSAEVFGHQSSSAYGM